MAVELEVSIPIAFQSRKRSLRVVVAQREYVCGRDADVELQQPALDRTIPPTGFSLARWTINSIAALESPRSARSDRACEVTPTDEFSCQRRMMPNTGKDFHISRRKSAGRREWEPVRSLKRWSSPAGSAPSVGDAGSELDLASEMTVMDTAITAFDGRAWPVVARFALSDQAVDGPRRSPSRDQLGGR